VGWWDGGGGPARSLRTKSAATAGAVVGDALSRGPGRGFRGLLRAWRTGSRAMSRVGGQTDGPREGGVRAAATTSAARRRAPAPSTPSTPRGTALSGHHELVKRCWEGSRGGERDADSRVGERGNARLGQAPLGAPSARPRAECAEAGQRRGRRPPFPGVFPRTKSEVRSGAAPTRRRLDKRASRSSRGCLLPLLAKPDRLDAVSELHPSAGPTSSPGRRRPAQG